MIYTVTVSGDIAAFRPNAVVVNEWSALSVAGVNASVRVISHGVAVLPKHVKRGGIVVEHPLDSCLSYRYNPWTNATVGYSTAIAHLLLCGDGISSINRTGAAVSLYNLPMGSVQISIASGEVDGLQVGEPIYAYQQNRYRYSDVLHLKTLSLDGYSGTSLVELARRTIEAAINAEELARKFLKDGFHLAGYIKVPVPLTDAQLDTMQASLKESFKGLDNAGGAPVLPFGAEYVPLTTSAVDAQLIETRQFLIEETCRFWGVPQHLLAKLNGGGGYNSIAQMGAEVVRYVLRYYVEQLDEELTNKLLTDEERAEGLYIECDLTYLERGDWETCVNAANVLVTGGVLTDNQGLALVGYGPREGGDRVRDPSYAQREQPEQAAPKPSGEAEHAAPATDATSALQPVLEAAVARVQAKAAKALGKPLSVAAGNVFADQQAGYVVQELQPYNDAVAYMGGKLVDAQRVAQRYADAIKLQVSTGAVADLAAIVQGVCDGN